MTHSSISGAILVGGRSRRMGVPKALLRLDDGGATLIERVAATLGEVADDVILVGTPDWRLPPSLAACRQVADPGTSAADGIVAALDAATDRFCVVVACDMPFLDAGLLRQMRDLALTDARGVIAIDARGVHPLHAVWDRGVIELVRTAVDAGERSLATLARRAGMAPLDLGAPGRSDRERWSVFNVNTPDDLAIARRHAADTR